MKKPFRRLFILGFVVGLNSAAVLDDILGRLTSHSPHSVWLELVGLVINALTFVLGWSIANDEQKSVEKKG